MNTVALGMSESEFITALEDAVKSADASAKVVPLQAVTGTTRTVLKTVTFGLVSSVDKREAVYAALFDFARTNLKVIDYEGWKMYVEDKTFNMVIHNITVKLHEKKGC